jgi:hypothetical protein
MEGHSLDALVLLEQEDDNLDSEVTHRNSEMNAVRLLH